MADLFAIMRLTFFNCQIAYNGFRRFNMILAKDLISPDSPHQIVRASSDMMNFRVWQPSGQGFVRAHPGWTDKLPCPPATECIAQIPAERQRAWPSNHACQHRVDQRFSITNTVKSNRAKCSFKCFNLPQSLPHLQPNEVV